MRGPTKTFPLDLVAVTAVISTVAVIYGSTRAFYFEGGFLQSFSFVSDERVFNEIVNGWIGRDPASTLFGIHAFGDYLMPNVWSSFGDSWTEVGGVNYLPPVLLLFRLLGFLPYAAGLALYMAAMAVATIAPMIWASRGLSLAIRTILVVSLALFTGPTIAAFDRGNIQGFMPLLFFAFALMILKSKWKWAALILTVMVLIKIYPVILVVVFVALRKYLWAVVVLAGTAVATAAVLPVMSTSGFRSLGAVIEGVVQFQDKALSDFLIYNNSFVGGLANGAMFLGQDGVGAWIASNAIVVTGLYALGVLPMMWLSRIPLWMRLCVGFSLTTSLMPLVYPYALNWIVAASALAIWAAMNSTSDESIGVWSQRMLVIALALGSAVLPIFIPGSMEAGRPAGVASLAAVAIAVAFPLAAWLSRSKDIRVNPTSVAK